jgi:hypothetical protein
MARLTVYCPDCGGVHLRSAFVKVIRIEASTTPWAYRFRCPTCLRLAVVPIRVMPNVDRLIQVGCKVVIVLRPGELDERGNGPVIADTDAAELATLLADDQALAAWLNPELPNEGTAP